MRFFPALRNRYRAVTVRKQAQKDRMRRMKIAMAFNDRYTFREEYVPGMDRLPGAAMGGITPRGGFAWMCPECNTIHHPYACSVWSGVQYPKCCSTEQGHRLSYGILSSSGDGVRLRHGMPRGRTGPRNHFAWLALATLVVAAPTVFNFLSY